VFGTLRASLRLLGILFSALLLNIFLLLLLPFPRLRPALTSLFFNWLLVLSGIEVQGFSECEVNAPKEQVLVVANHVSYLDILIINALFPCVFLAKSEVAGWPVFGWVARALGCVFVKRDSLMGRANALRSCLRTLKTNNLALFPEGTTTSLRHPPLDSWTRGHGWIAKRAGIQFILCFGLAYENQEQAAWTDDTSLLPHLLQTLRAKRTRVRMNAAWMPVQSGMNTNEIARSTHKNICWAVDYVGAR
jgi:1-acyl-sn-glycerol-3-phosphate acyltransferase